VGALETNTTLIYGVHIRESANDGSDFTNAASDYRVLFLGEDGELHVKDSAGTVTDIGASGGGAPTNATYLTASANGTLSDEVVVTAPASGGIVAKIVRKTADEIVNNSTTLQNDDHLLLALLANEVWRFEIDAWYAAATTTDLKVLFTVPAAATFKWWAPESYNATSGAWGTATDTEISAARPLEGAGSTSPRGLHIIGVVVNGANAGNLQLQWAQVTAGASDATVYANSILRAWKIA
jgi:hypothetical protein